MLWAGSAAAQQAVDSGGRLQGQDEKPTARDDGRRTLARLPVNLALGALGVFSRDNMKPAIVGIAATGSAAGFDHQVADALVDLDSGSAQWLQTGGGPVASASMVAAVFVASRLTDGHRFRALGYDWVNASVVTAGYTALLKEAVSRERPNGEDNKSFPSGHTSNAFALATVAERHYGWKVGIPAYGLAAVVGLSRLQKNAHYLSDVVAGATLGYIVGRTVVRVNGGVAAPTRAQINVSPAVGRKIRMLVVQVSF